MNDYSFRGRGTMNLSAQLQETAKKFADKPAYYFMGHQSTYAELDGVIQKFASGLEKLGIKQGDHIALLLGNSPHFIISLYGALRLGVTVIPVNPIYTADEIGFILNNGDVKALVALDLALPVAEKMHTLLPRIEHYIFCETKPNNLVQSEIENLTVYAKMKSFTEVIASGELSFQGPMLKDEDVAIILYTSGTTGKAKGAMLTHKNIYSN